MTPSNANTSGLEVVAWRVKHPRHDAHRLCFVPAPADEAEPLVTAASAQARISELSEQNAAFLDLHNDMSNRMVAAEARADRLAQGITSAKLILTPEPGDNPLTGREKTARQFLAALQQEG